MLVVVKIYEDSFKVGTALQAGTWDEAYDLAQEFVLDEIEARGMDVSGNTREITEIDEIIRENNYYLFDAEEGNWMYGCEKGKAVAVQIIEVE